MKKRLDLTLFDEVIRHAILVAGMGCGEKADNLSKDALCCSVYQKAFPMTYNKQSKVVSCTSLYKHTIRKTVNGFVCTKDYK